MSPVIPWLQFVELDDTVEWHSFISPSDILHATHTIPTFEWNLMEPQLCHEGSHAVRFLKDNWNYYYVNIFVDRDMFMRYQGGGVGHLYMRAIEAWLTETGWGSDDALACNLDSDADSEEEGEDSGDSKDGRSNGNSEDEVSDKCDALPDRTTYSDQESGSDMDPEAEYASGEDNEETLDGEYSFSGL
ncbi:hypothetical protein BDM02DRAFT_3190600 [Thelephora ganbajun]|uniref:Uncharacterized protein n=1 Tax=Thelephora ganbajun TaxID=370292 RepID=A0ACB6Z4D8_THEGA|nr:hypothetical protein BDM02DRAFT_3190600 [Thelephora ganbajun]